MKDKYFFPVIVVMFLLVSNPVYAYIDPGTGSIIFQAVAAGLLGFGYAFKLSYGRLKGIFGSKKNRIKDPENE